MQRMGLFLSRTSDPAHLAAIAVGLGGRVVGTYGVGRHRRGWKNLLAHLDAVDQVMVETVNDLPMKSLNELLSTITHLHDQKVSLYVVSDGVDTLVSPGTTILGLMTKFRRTRRSEAIQKGQAKASAAGKKIGRPMVPPKLRKRIAAAVANGGGIRPTARQFGVSAATVINICGNPTASSALAA